MKKKEKDLTDLEKKLIRRQKRAPKNAKVPDLDRIFILKLNLPKNISLEEVIEYLKHDPNVEYAEPNYIIKLDFTPNDTLYPLQWGLNNTGQVYPASGSYNTPPGTTDCDINAPEAWDSVAIDDIIIAVVDSGVDYNHRDIDDNIWINTNELNGEPNNDDDFNGCIDDIYGYDFCTYNLQQRDSDPMDEYGHGTHCAGIIAAEMNNNQDISGICRNTKIMAVKAFDSDGEGSYVDAIEACYYAVENGADIISNSWGVGFIADNIKEVVDYAISQGVIVVASAGNDVDDTRNYPAAYDNVISVGATDSNDWEAYFSSYGYSVDIAAPGVDILSLKAENTDLGTAYDSYTTIASGTSMSCPFAAGVAGLILQKNPTFTYEEVKSVLKMTSDPIYCLDYAGQGRINAYNTLQISSPPVIAKLDIEEYDSLDEYDSKIEKVFTDFPVNGTAKGANFNRYEIYCGEGKYPTDWDLIYTGYSVVDNGLLLPSFDISSVNEGYNAIKLVVYDNLGYHVDAIDTIYVDHFIPISPMNNDILKPGGVFDIKANISLDIISHKVEYGFGFDPQTWYSDGITTQSGENNLWATWDTSSITTETFCNLKYTYSTADKQYEEYVDMIYFNPMLKEGWPVYIENDTGSINHGDFQDAIISDINKDGDYEAITVRSVPYVISELQVYNHEGILLWSKDITTSFEIPAVDDLDGDGYKEIVCFSECNYISKIIVFKYDGSNFEGNWQSNITTPYHLFPIIADLNHDNKKEIIFSGNSHLIVTDYIGNILTYKTWALLSPGGLGVSPQRHPAVGNFDEDDDLEIAIYYDAGKVAILNMDGTMLPGWPVEIGTAHLYYNLKGMMVTGDVDNDGYDDLVVTTVDLYQPENVGVYVYNKNGELLPGWPILNLNPNFFECETASLADFDKDGDLEISFASGEKVYVYHHTGEIATGWPQETNIYSPVWRSCSIGDINGDNVPDVLVSAGGIQPITLDDGSVESDGGIFAWNYDGSPIDLNSSPDSNVLYLEHGGHISVFKAPVSIVDIDNDGDVELVASSIADVAYSSWRTESQFKNRSSIYVYELGTKYDRLNMPWQMFQHDSGLTGHYITPQPTPLPLFIENFEKY